MVRPIRTEHEWDNFCGSKPQGGMIRIPISIAIHMNRLRIPCWSVWQTADTYGKAIYLLDYGCGKGRVEFYLSWQIKCRTIGIEYDNRIYEKAEENRKTAAAAERTTFVQANAEQFPVPEEVDRIYFFNPFSLEIPAEGHPSDSGILLCQTKGDVSCSSIIHRMNISPI